MKFEIQSLQGQNEAYNKVSPDIQILFFYPNYRLFERVPYLYFLCCYSVYSLFSKQLFYHGLID